MRIFARIFFGIVGILKLCMLENRNEQPPLPIPAPEETDATVALPPNATEHSPDAHVGSVGYVVKKSRRGGRGAGGRAIEPKNEPETTPEPETPQPPEESLVPDEGDMDGSESPEDSASVYPIGGDAQPEVVPTQPSFYEREVKERLAGDRSALLEARETTRKAGVKAGDIAKIERLYKEELARQEQEWKKTHPEDPFEPETFAIRYGVIDKYLKGSWNENFISLQRGRFWFEKGRNNAAVALQDYFVAQDGYDDAKKALAKELWEQKTETASVEKAADFDFNKDAFLKTARVELFGALLLDERGELERLAHEQLPPQEKNMFFAALDTWRSIPLVGRLLITTAIATSVTFAVVPSVGVVGAAGYAGSRLVRGFTSSLAANVASKFAGSFLDKHAEENHQSSLEDFSKSISNTTELNESSVVAFDNFLSKKQDDLNKIFNERAFDQRFVTALKILVGVVVANGTILATQSVQHVLENTLRPADSYLEARLGASGGRSSAVDHTPAPKAGSTSNLNASEPTSTVSENAPGQPTSTTTTEAGTKTSPEASNSSPAVPAAGAKQAFTGPKVLDNLKEVEKSAKPLSNYFVESGHIIERPDLDKLHELATVGKGGSAWKAVYDQLDYMVKNKLVDPSDLGIKLSNLDVENPVKLRHALDARVLEILKEDGYLRDGVDVRIARPGVPLDLKIGADGKGGVHVFIKQPDVPAGQKPVFYNYEENRTSAPTPAHEIPKTRFAVASQNTTIPLDNTPRASASSLVQRAPLDPEFGKHSVPISKADVDAVRNSSEALSGELNKNRIFSSLPDSAPSLSPRVMLEVIHAQPSQAQAVDMFLSRLKFDDRFVESKWPLFEHMSVGEFSTHINSLQLLREAERSALFGGRATPVSFRLDLRTDFIGRSASIEIPADTRMYLLADFMATQKNLIEASVNVRGQSLAQFLLNRATR